MNKNSAHTHREKEKKEGIRCMCCVPTPKMNDDDPRNALHAIQFIACTIRKFKLE